MQNEYLCLVVMTSLYLVAWLPGSFGKWKSFGSRWVASNRDPLPGKELLPWAGRCDRAYNNLKDYFPGFVVAILLLGQVDKFNTATMVASIIYVLARLGHFTSYAAGNVPLRASFFALSLLSNFYLLWAVFA